MDSVTKEASAISNYFTKYLDEGKLKESIEKIPHELLLLDEYDLSQRFNPSSLDWDMRRNFHRLMEECKSSTRSRIMAIDVYDHVMARQAFYARVMPNHVRMAWIIRPMPDNQKLIDETLQYALQKLKRIIINADENEPKYANAILNAAKFLADRSMGSVAQRIEQKNLNVDANRLIESGASPTELESRFSSLSGGRDASVTNRAEKDVTPVATPQVEGGSDG